MQINTLQLKNIRKKRKTIGRGGKKGTYSGKGIKGQKARSGAHVNPLFEGGRSTLTDHLKKVRGFKSVNPKKSIVKISTLEKNFQNDDIINVEALVKAGVVSANKANNGVKILGNDKLSIKLTIGKDILLSASAREAVTKAGGIVEAK